MTQTEKLKAKLLLQVQRILTKFKPLLSREISNQEMAIMLYQYSTGDTRNEYNEDDLEWIHNRLTRLNKNEMSIIKKRFWEAKSFEIVANEMGHIGDAKWAYREIERIIKKLSV